MLRKLDVTRIEIPLGVRSRRRWFLFAAAAASLFLAAETSLIGIASSFETPALSRWILPLDSSDPRFQNRLAQIVQEGQPAESVAHLRRAVELSPNSRLYWSDLAGTCEQAGDTPCVDRARERLLDLCPMAPLYRWQLAESYLRQKRVDEAVAQFRRALELDPKYALNAWSSLQPLLGSDATFQKLLGGSADSETHLGYVDFLSDQGINDDAFRVWKLVAANPRPFPFSAAKPYLERLIDLGRMDEAASVWQDLERLGVVTQPGKDQSGNLIFNGDFEQPPLNAGFDWRSWGQTYLAIDFSAPGAYSGARCLRVDFTVSRNNEYEPLYQVVAVLPGHRYQLESYVRSEDITSDSGPCLRIRDNQERP